MAETLQDIRSDIAYLRGEIDKDKDDETTGAKSFLRILEHVNFIANAVIDRHKNILVAFKIFLKP